MYVFKRILMLYYVIYKHDAYDIILDSFSSRDAADHFMDTMKFWFSKPLQIIELTRNRKVVRTPADKPA
jgi:aromatic ring-cleaving dioxygenase